jgi:hypothetical protein
MRDFSPLFVVFYPEGQRDNAVATAHRLATPFGCFVVIDTGCVWVFPDIFA